MKPTDKLIKVLFILLGFIILSFNFLLYHSFEQQKGRIDILTDKQKIDSQVNSNQFKYQQDQIVRLSKDLEESLKLSKDQNDALNEEKDSLKAQKQALIEESQKREQLENDSKGIQTSLVDIKAEADAIKQEMKAWQKDYVSVLAELETKINSSQDEIKSVKDNLDSLNIPELQENINSMKSDLEKLAHLPDNVPAEQPAQPASVLEKKSEHLDIHS